MTQAIPISQIVRVLPSVLSASGNAVNLNGLIVSQSAAIPNGQAIPFAIADDVASYTGAQSIEAEMANIYFRGFTNGTKTPGTLYLVRFNEQAASGSMRGASRASMTLDELRAVSGTFSIVIDGVQKDANVDLSDVTSFSDAAQTLGADLAADVTFDSLRQAFVVTSGTTGASSSVTSPGGLPVPGSPADVLGLTTAAGATVSPGADADDPGTFMANLVDRLTQNWALFTTTWEPETADKTEFSKWANSTGERFAYVGYDSDPNAKVAGSTTTWGYAVKQAEMEGTVPLFGDHTHAAFILGFAASLDFDRRNGRATLAFRTQSGLLPAVNSASDALALKANGYNFYGVYANSTASWNFMYAGVISGTWAWLDSFLNQIWLNANLQLAMVQLLMSINSLPYNPQGDSLVDAACLDPISKALNYGAIRTGIELSYSEVAQIQNALGFDASMTIQAKGFYLYIAPATADIRAARGSPPMTLYYTDGESMQALDLASVCVV
ncbi:hypothetical protein OKW30_001417 [Paraburkholderia sp. Clong3]|uniref:DUF3383 domain-containing protein n=1 Tax=Paraburkholderia sp. Clong3 TaxID=2991061 RepID=UPI003D2501CF